MSEDHIIDAELVDGPRKRHTPPPKPPRPLYPEEQNAAPIEVRLSIWPLKLKARATVTEKGKAPKNFEVASPMLALLLNFLRAQGAL